MISGPRSTSNLRRAIRVHRTELSEIETPSLNAVGEPESSPANDQQFIHEPVVRAATAFRQVPVIHTDASHSIDAEGLHEFIGKVSDLMAMISLVYFGMTGSGGIKEHGEALEDERQSKDSETEDDQDVGMAE